MIRTSSFALATVLLAGSAMQPASAAGANAPPDPFIHKGVCPFECCTYRDWTASKAIELFSAPRSRKMVTKINSGDVVRSVTGDVFAKPTPIVATHDYADSPIRKGDKFYALHAGGEGYWSVWYRGKVYSIEFDGNEPAKDESVWWVKIRTRSGATGWTISDGNFQNQDSCG